MELFLERFIDIEPRVLWIALITGIIPTLMWLFFWLREDRFNPEPPGLLILTFLAGAVSVFLILPLAHVAEYFGIKDTQQLLFYAAAEETIKLLIVVIIDFSSTHLDEPIDYAIYLITGALGFAMMENVLFLTRPELQDNISFIIETGTLRFLGASILHAVLAAILGIILGFVFYKRRITRIRFMLAGLMIVTILHTIFNYFIIKYVEINSLVTLGILWVVTIIIIALFERVRAVNH